MQVYKRSSGDKPVLPQPFDFSHYAGYPSKPLMRIDVKRREIWEWRDHTPLDGAVIYSIRNYDHASVSSFCVTPF